MDGFVAPRFEAVRDTLAEVSDGSDTQLAIYVDGELVVDLWSSAELPADAVTPVYSITKGATHLTAALLVQRGALQLDRRVSEYWPDFPAVDGDTPTVRELLSHQAGLIGVEGGFTLDELADDRRIARRLAAERPRWRPGSGYGYHAFVIGALVNEVIIGATGRTLREWYEELVRRPYQLDLYMGLPDALEPRFRAAQPLVPTAEQQQVLDASRPAPDSLMAIAFNLNANPATDLLAFGNHPAVRAAGQGSAGGVGNARSVAKMYAAAIGRVDGRAALLAPATLAEFTRPHGTGADLVTGERDHFLLGFEAMQPRYPQLSAATFGHSGAAGSQGFADPELRLAYGYVRRRFAFQGGPGAPENLPLIDAVVSSLAGR
jgi:CubicO group peptidase (beta-lactamase class C family)